MSTGPIEQRQRSASVRRTAPLPANPQPQGAAPAVASGDRASLSGTTGTRPLSAALAEAQAKNPLATLGNSVVTGSRDLIEGGYRYPPNDTNQYYHIAGKIGCCADFACDSYAKAGDDIAQQMSQLGYNPHYCPSMVQYFQAHQLLISPHSRAHVGDMVFFNWDGSGTADHVAIVTKVDANGVPTQIAESSNFNQPAHLTTVNSYLLSHMIAFGRVKGAGADDGAAAQLSPITNPAPAEGPEAGSSSSYGGDSGTYASAPAGSGYDAPGAATSVPSEPTSAENELAQLMLLDSLYDMLGKDFGISPANAKALLDAKRAGKDVAAEARKLGIPENKIPQLLKEVDRTAAKADQIAGKNNLPLPSGQDAWGLNKADGEKALAAHRTEIDRAAKAAGIDPKALAAALWMHGNFDLGSNPAATIQAAASDLKAHWKSGDLAGSVMATLDPGGRMSPGDRDQTLQLFANRYAAVSEIEAKDEPASAAR